MQTDLTFELWALAYALRVNGNSNPLIWNLTLEKPPGHVVRAEGWKRRVDRAAIELNRRIAAVYSI